MLSTQLTRDTFFFVADRPGGSGGNLENLLTLGREFESRCSRTNRTFAKKTNHLVENDKFVGTQIRLHGRRGKGTAEPFSR